MTEKIDTYKLANGMTILGVPMASVQSVAFGFLLPAGAAMISDGCSGAGTVISDWIFRGAGNKTSRELADSLDGLGLHRGSSVESKHLALSASLDDDPRQKTMFLLRENFYPDPLGTSPIGNQQDLQNLTVEKCKQIIDENFNISQTVFAVAGKYDFKKLCPLLEKLFGNAKPRKQKDISPKEQMFAYHHQQHDGAQVHIGIMTRTVTPQNLDYYNARVAVAILSGGMSSRLFTEVREKRGLCYAIGASYHSLKEMAGIACYAGTTPDKAQETYDVIITEFKRLADSLSESELQRAKIGLQSSLIMQSESTIARAGAAAKDYYMLGEVRSLEEIKQNIEKTSVQSIIDFLKNNTLEKFCSATIGPKKIKPV